MARSEPMLQRRALCAARNAPPDHEATLNHGATLQGKRVLVVEDEVLVSMLVEDELLDAGATVLGPAPSVGDALRLVEEAAADGGLSAAVLDINLDGRRVWPVADQLAALGVPFLFATGYGKGCDTGVHRAAPVLHKPFGVEALIATVTALASARDAAERCIRPVTARSVSGKTTADRCCPVLVLAGDRHTTPLGNPYRPGCA
jgi:DNA-binding response OmpR family regulator